MRACRIKIKNFRGIKSAKLLLPTHAVLVGDNNTGKTTVLEALDLVLGPDRLNRQPPIDEHDFFQGKYLSALTAVTGNSLSGGIENGAGVAANADSRSAGIPEQENPLIEVEVTITDLNDEHKGRFGDYIEFWDTATDTFYEQPDAAGVDGPSITEALRVTFRGSYDAELDDFEGKTYFARSITEEDSPISFSKKDKQTCGFLYLRSLRTASRALSLERGSLLDIILRLKEVRPRMWEDTISALSAYSVASNPELGISGVLQSINAALKEVRPEGVGDRPSPKGVQSNAGAPA